VAACRLSKFEIPAKSHASATKHASPTNLFGTRFMRGLTSRYPCGGSGGFRPVPHFIPERLLNYAPRLFELAPLAGGATPHPQRLPSQAAATACP